MSNPGRPERPQGRGGSRPGGKPAGKAGAGRTGGGKPTGKPSRGKPGGQPTGGRGGDRSFHRPRRDDSTPRGHQPRSEEQARYDGPPLEEDITGRELDHNIRQQLRGLPEKLAARVARHLVAAGRLIDEDPRTAYQHTLAARSRAPRIGVVREACGEAAYAAGEFAEALAELRAAKRMTGDQSYLPVMADCERALGRPEKALALAKNPALEKLPQELRVEMTIVQAGALHDLGDTDTAVRLLERAPLNSRSREPWVARLRYAYADMLLAAGRHEDGLVWFHRTAGIDGEGITDAAERLVELEGLVVTDAEEPDEPTD